jgi:replication-associated recombination protein RarA
MTPQSARTMMWAALALLLVSGMIGAAEAGVLMAVLAACCALAAVGYGTKGIRIAAVLILLASLGLAAALYPAANQEMAAYRGRTQPAPETVPPGPAEAR